MNETLQQCSTVLTEAGFAVRLSTVHAAGEDAELLTLVFEDATVLGFILVYETAAELIERWRSDSARVAMRHRDSLRIAERKAWNAYLVLIAQRAASFNEAQLLGQIEQDLEGLRKITKAGVTGIAGTHATLLPLLPFSAAPVLDPIDMPAEIRVRSSELEARLVEAFLSNAKEDVVQQLLEEEL